MKRFYCTICKKVKRVRNYPNNVFNPLAPLPEDRIGECNRHNEMHPRALRGDRLNSRKVSA
jgi:hypothetical protein